LEFSSSDIFTSSKRGRLNGSDFPGRKITGTETSGSFEPVRGRSRESEEPQGEKQK
jgi:hypothetical protein